MEKEEIDTIKDVHKRTFAKLVAIECDDNKLLKSWQLWIAVTVSVIISICIICVPQEVDSYMVLQDATERALSILPNVLGFNLGAYVLFVSLSSEKLLNELTEPDEKSRYTTYQHMSAVFAWSILIQAFSLIFSFICSVIMSLNIQSQYSDIVNIAILAITVFISVYAVLLIYRMILNVFSIGQVIHFSTIMSKLENKHDK